MVPSNGNTKPGVLSRAGYRRYKGRTLNKHLPMAFASAWFILASSTVASESKELAESQTPVELRLRHIPFKDRTDPLSVAKRRVFEAFCRTYPHIQVRGPRLLAIEGAGRGGREFLAIAGGVGPDVYHQSGRRLGDYLAQGFAHPLDDYLAKHKQQTGQPYVGINAPSIVWEPCQHEGHLYAVPYLYYSMALMCRRDVFARAGVPLEAPTDWEQLYQTARQLTWLPSREPGGPPGQPPVYGLESVTGPRAGWHMLQYIWSSGGEVVRAHYPVAGGEPITVPPPSFDHRRWQVRLSDGAAYDAGVARWRRALGGRGVPNNYTRADLQWRLVVDDLAGLEVLKFHRRLTHAPWIRCENQHDEREYDVTTSMFRDRQARCPQCGRTVDLITARDRQRVYRGVVQVGAADDTARRALFAMRIGTIQELGVSSDRSLEVPVPFPSRTRELPPASLIAGHYLAINATQKDPRVRDAAWDYIRFMTGPEAQRIRVETYIEYGLEAFVRPSVLRKLGMTSELARIPAPRLRLWDQLERSARVEPYCRGFTNVMTRELAMPMEAVFADVPDPEGRYSRDLNKLLADTCRRVNTQIIGDLPTAVLTHRTRIGSWIVGSMVAVGLAAMAWRIGRARRAMANTGTDCLGRVRLPVTGLVFLAPAVGLTLLWQYIPLLRGTAMAFTDFRILGGSSFVGMENFVETTAAPEFWRYVWQTCVYVLLSLITGFITPIALALFLTEIPRGRVLFRTLYYLPAVTTGIVTLFMWKQLFYDPAPTGLINRVLLTLNDQGPVTMTVLKGLIVLTLLLAILGLVRAGLASGVSAWGRVLALVPATILAIGFVTSAVEIRTDANSAIGWWHWLTAPWAFEPQRFLIDREMAMFWIVVPTVWAGLGPACLIYLAALKSIPEAQYEAADIDGAGVWSKCTAVVFPHLSALIVINLVGAVVGAMQASQNIFVMTGGGPEDATMTVGLSVWYQAYMFLNFGLATAQAWILGAMLIGFTLYQLRLLRRVQFHAAAGREVTA